MRRLLLILGLLVACEGQIGDVDPLDGPRIPSEGVYGNGRLPTRVWRLTPEQFEHEAERILGDLPEAGRYPAGASQNGLSNIAANGFVDRAAAQRILQITDEYAAHVEANAAEVSRCGADFGSAACADEFIAWFSEAAYRRPVMDDERDALRTLYDRVEAEHDATYAFRILVQTVLISPHMLYRMDLGAPFDGSTTGEPGEGERIVVLSDFEIANLLSFALTDEGPDGPLLEAAAAGRLRDASERATHVRRLMARSHGVWRRFFWEWLDMQRFDPQADALGIAPSLRAAMRQEYDEFIGRVVVEDRGSLDDVFTATRSWGSAELATFYGVGHDGGEVAPMEFGAERAGLLTQAAWLVSHGSREDEFVVRRGMGLFLHALCRDLTPPAGLDVNAAQATLTPPDATVREKVEARSGHEVCGACHQTPDPIGLAFERFDALGQLRDAYEDGTPIDSNATVPGIGAVSSAAELGAQLVEAEEFQTCFVRRVAHSMLGADLGSRSDWLNEVQDSFEGEGRSIEALVVALASHPGFIERSASTETRGD